MNVSALTRLSKRFIKTCFVSIDSKAKDIFTNTSINSSIIRFRNFSSLSEDNHSNVSKPLLRLLTKENCMLCEEAKHILFSAPGNYEKRLVLKEVDIRAEGNEDLFDLYRYEIPVFFLGRKFISKNFIDLEKLEQELTKLEIDQDGTKQNE